MKNENEHYLADWLAGEITDDQLRQLVSEADFAAFQTIKVALANSRILAPETDASFFEIKRKLAAQKGERPGKVIPLWSYAVAACLLVVLGLYQLYFLSNETQADFGTTTSVVLNDNSKVTLNSNSNVCYSNLFQYNRTLELQGEAFFEVEKGSQFTVKTKLGTVTVLGTQFNVAAFSDYFEVVCYEGKVKVATPRKTTILTKGETVRFYDDEMENWADTRPERPLWTSGETELRKLPMKYVFAKFENQFDVKVVFPKNIENWRFSGSFPNTDMETALKSICIPLQLNYSITASGVIQISE